LEKQPKKEKNADRREKGILGDLDGQAKMGRRMRGIAEQDQAKKGVKIK
jgi:hypothetical protein